MNNLKIEYANGVLVAVEYNGKSYMDLPLSALHFRHEKNHNPYFKIEVEEGGEQHEPLKEVSPEPPSAPEPTLPVTGELIPAAVQPPRKPRRHRHKRSNSNV
ncbi:hypothetical protein [Pluralibacter gergoviae]|uniref:hypothetical protein n=1 Tax=Pluralibacter gergoviae TaxID=61647 RepID=UPI0004F7B7A1|nr:hypothetical protein [Pluralibacter gergoviae]